MELEKTGDPVIDHMLALREMVRELGGDYGGFPFFAPLMDNAEKRIYIVGYEEGIRNAGGKPPERPEEVKELFKEGF